MTEPSSSAPISSERNEFPDDEIFGDEASPRDQGAVRKASTGAGIPDYAMPALGGAPGASMDMLMDVGLQVTVELGRTRMTVRQILELQRGSVVELNRIAGDAVDIYVNERLIGRGEVVVVDDKFGVRITELVSPNRKNGEN
jgi:flagellar motor switch protein FliN